MGLQKNMINYISPNDLDINHKQHEEDKSNDDEFDLLDSLEWLQNKGKRVDKQEKFFGSRDRYLQARNIAFLNNNVLLLEEPYSNPKFLMDKKGFHIEKSIDGLLTNYKFHFN